MSTSPEYDYNSGILRSVDQTGPEHHSSQDEPTRNTASCLRERSSVAPKKSSKRGHPYRIPSRRVKAGRVQKTPTGRRLDKLDKRVQGLQTQHKLHKNQQRGVSGRDKQRSTTDTILPEKPVVKWTDIRGLDAAKKFLKDAVILPRKHPSLFINLRPWRDFLLYGPAGTDKTLLAKALAHEAGGLAFFSVSATDLPSTWNGESAHYIKAVIEAARQHKPSVIFIDQIDVLCTARSIGDVSGTDARAELCVHMDELKGDMDGILIIGATHAPWELDGTFRRRFHKRICVPLPSGHERAELFRSNFEGVKHDLVGDDYRSLARKTENYSGADIAEACRDACLAPVRRLQKATHFRLIRNPDTSSKTRQLYEMCERVDRGAVRMKFDGVPKGEHVQPAVTLADAENALNFCKAQATEKSLYKLKKFIKQYG